MTSGNGSATTQGRAKSSKSKAKDEDALMDFAPGKVLGAEELSSVKGSVTAKLSELMGEPCDEVFPEYVTVMVSNGKTIREISTQLEDLLTAGTATVFSKWLGNHLRGLGKQKNPASAPIEAAPANTGGSRHHADGGATGSSSSKSRANPKSKSSGIGNAGKGASDRSSRGGGGSGGVAVSEDSGGGGKIGGTGGKDKASGSKAPKMTSGGGARDGGSREWSESRSRETDSWDSSRDRSRGSSRDRSRDASRDRLRHSRDSSRDVSTDRSRGRGRERPGERSRDRPRDRSRERSRDLPRGRSRDNIRDGKDRLSARSRDSRDRDRLRDYGSFVTGKDRSHRDTNAGPRDRYRNSGAGGGVSSGNGGRVNDDWDRSRDRTRDPYSRAEERGGGRWDSRHGGATHVAASTPRVRNDRDNGRRARERSVERPAERPVRARGKGKEEVNKEEEQQGSNAAESSKEGPARDRGERGERGDRRRGKDGDRGRDREEAKGAKKARHKNKEEKFVAKEGREEDEVRGGPVNSTVVVTPPVKIEEPKTVSVVSSVAVVGDGVKKEELDAANERAKLPDLRTVIERSRRRPNPAAQEEIQNEGREGDHKEQQGKKQEEQEQQRKDEEKEKRSVVVKGRMAGVKGGMRGFSPGKAPSNGRESGVKRDFSQDVPPPPRQLAFAAATGGGRLLSTAVKQSVRSAAMAPGQDASGGSWGEKRRKSGGGDGDGDDKDVEASRFVRPSGNGAGGSAVEPDEVPGNNPRALMGEESATGLGASPVPSSLRASAPEFHSSSHGASRPGLATPSASLSGLTNVMPSYQQSRGLGPDASAWQPLWKEETTEIYGQTFGSVNHQGSGRGHSDVWDRLGPRANGDGGGVGDGIIGSGNSATQTAPAVASFPVEQGFLDGQARHPAGGGGVARAQSWSEWAQSIGSVPGSPSDAASKWAAALRVAAGAATAAAASSSVNSGVGGGGGGGVTPLTRGGSEDLAYMASYNAAARAEEGLPLTAVGWSDSVGGSRRGSVVGRGGRGLSRGRFGRGGGRNFTWVREGLRGRGRGRGVPGGRGFVGTFMQRGRGVVAKSLGRSGGWHSTGSVVGRGAAAAVDSAQTGTGRGGGGRDPAIGQRETWHKVWVREELREAEESGASNAHEQTGDTM